MRWHIAAALCLTVVAATGCNALSSLLPEGKKMNYKSAGKLPPLEIPPDLTSPGSDERFIVPDISPSGSATFSAYNAERNKTPNPAGAAILPSLEEGGVRMGARAAALAGGKGRTGGDLAGSERVLA